jgi:hypothetical protein
VTTRLKAGHPSVEEKHVEVKEYVHFKTKGLPGLNAQGRIGEELEPYVKSTYRDTGKRLYREEPVAIQFHEDYLVVVPLNWRPFGGLAAESDQLFRLALTATPDTAADPGLTFDTTAPDWLTDHRKALFATKQPQGAKAQLHKSKLMVTHTTSTSPALARLAGLTQRPTTTCRLGDPREVIAPVLLAQPQGTPDPRNPVGELWPGSARCTATVRPEESPYVTRAAFEAADASAFTFSADDTGGNGTAWEVQDGELRLTQAGARHFAVLGERTWDHLKVQVEVKPGTGTAGVGCGIDLHGDLHYEEFRNQAKTNVPERGLFAVIEPLGNKRRLAIYRRTNLQEFYLLESKDLAAGNQEAFTLVVHVFDDKLRLTVGDVSIEADREDLRAGRLALLGQGAVAFQRLQVEGLPMYAFPFQVSRYRGFAEHIGSFGGTVMTVAAGDMGQGASSKDVAGMWADTGAQVGLAMQSSVPAEEREKLFAAWLAGLGLPVQAELTALEITRFCEAGLTRCLLLDSPEPLDFAGEVRLELYRRILVPSKVKAIDMVEVGRVLGSVLAPGATTTPILQAATRERGREGIVGTRRAPGRLRVDLEPSLLDEGRPGMGLGSELAVVEVEESPGAGRLAARVYRGALSISAGGQPFVDASEVSQVNLPPGSGQGDPLTAAGLKKGTVLVADLQRAEVVAVFAPHYDFEPVEIQVLQNGGATRAIVVPFSGGKAVALAPGVYRLDFAIDRKRWLTTDPPDETNSYRATASVTVTL